MTGGAGEVRVHLLGVRGSTPVSGARFAEVGGRTSCLAVEPAPGTDGRWLVLDAGTGFTSLADLLHGEPLRADVVLSHLHWDHLQGLPFLANADRDDAQVDLWIPAPESADGSDGDVLARLAQGFGPPFFPIRPDGLRGRWRFHAPLAGVLPIGVPDTTVAVGPVLHKGGPTVGVRVERAGRAFAYLPDHCIGRADAEQLAQARHVCRGVDVLFHDAQHLEAERAMADEFGHCTVADAVDLAASAGAARLVLVHHAPGRDDDAIGRVLAEARAHAHRCGVPLTVDLGREGQVVDI